jgi:hypothetical protein
MPALTLNGEVVDLSYTYDALTVYPLVDSNIGDITSCVSKCSQFGFVLKASPHQKGLPTQQGRKLTECIGEIDSSKGVQRFIHRHDDDHDLYHQDSFSIDKSHYHLKFHRALTRTQLSQVLDVFEEAELIIREQKEAFMASFDARYLEVREAANKICVQVDKDETLSARKKHDVTGLLQLIGSIRDNDRLVDLHDHLLSNTFDHLREITEVHPSKEWQGVDRSGAVVKTSKAWAGLEKAISLQMIKNLQEQSQRFSSDFGKERARQLADSHRFFGIKRTRSLADPNKARTFKTLDAFARADSTTLERKYKKVFK